MDKRIVLCIQCQGKNGCREGLGKTQIYHAEYAVNHILSKCSPSHHQTRVPYPCKRRAKLGVMTIVVADRLLAVVTPSRNGGGIARNVCHAQRELDIRRALANVSAGVAFLSMSSKKSLFKALCTSLGAVYKRVSVNTLRNGNFPKF